jgi:hypothetical protein
MKMVRNSISDIKKLESEKTFRKAEAKIDFLTFSQSGILNQDF